MSGGVPRRPVARGGCVAFGWVGGGGGGGGGAPSSSSSSLSSSTAWLSSSPPSSSSSSSAPRRRRRRTRRRRHAVVVLVIAVVVVVVGGVVGVAVAVAVAAVVVVAEGRLARVPPLYLRGVHARVHKYVDRYYSGAHPPPPGQRSEQHSSQGQISSEVPGLSQSGGRWI